MAGAVAAAALTSTLDRRRMAELRAELAALDTMSLEPARKAEIRSSLGYHLAGVQRSGASRLTLRAPYVPVFGLGVITLAAGGVLARRRRGVRPTGKSGAA